MTSSLSTVSAESRSKTRKTLSEQVTIGFSHCCDLLMWQEMFKGFEKEAELVFFILLFCSLLSFYPQGWCVLLLSDEHGFWKFVCS